MISDKQSLILCGLMTAGIFIGGVLDVLSNFIVLTLLTIVFSAILVNLFYTKKEESRNNK